MYKDSSSSNFPLSIISMHGQKVSMDVTPDMSMETIKEESVKKLSSTRGSGVDGSQEYVLIRTIGTFSRLPSKSTVKAENLSTGDCLLLYKSQSKYDKEEEIGVRTIPTIPSIKKATEGLPVRDKSTSGRASAMSGQSSGGNLEHTFRKILLTLLDLSYKLMFFDEEADGLFVRKMNKSTIDPALISSLTSMGFSESRASKALKLNHMSMEAAMEWLLQHPEDDQSEPMTVEKASEESESESDEDERHSAKRVKKRLEGWQKKTRRFQPSKEHISALEGMGFSREDCIQALRLNGNNPNAACDWLLGDRKVPDDDPNDSLSPDSELYKAIVSNPTIHIGLHNKRVLEALEDMLENPLRRHNWANDSTVGSVILQILKLYHKYSTSGS